MRVMDLTSKEMLWLPLRTGINSTKTPISYETYSKKIFPTDRNDVRRESVNGIRHLFFAYWLEPWPNLKKVYEPKTLFLGSQMKNENSNWFNIYKKIFPMNV